MKPKTQQKGKEREREREGERETERGGWRDRGEKMPETDNEYGARHPGFKSEEKIREDRDGNAEAC